ncbi:MAG TPA: FkbM family methyltransferase [Thermoanaerobaculia bacterium]|nr:FkbM family methyltransferase [Thermoanaerobaculia bacterium]
MGLANRLFADAPQPSVFERPFFGYHLLVDVSRSNAQRLLYLEGERFMAERFLLRRLLRPGLRVVDVGANIGYYLLLTSRLIGPQGSISCFEPEPENVIELERNMERNRLNNVQVFPVAAGDADGEVSLHPGINGKVAADGSGSLTVSLRRLDSVLSGPVDLVKVDVEGYEGHVLAGAERLLAEHRPVLFVEIHPTFLAPPTSLDELFAQLTTQYPHVQAYTRAAHRSFRDLTSRYLPGAGVARVPDLAALLDACRAGHPIEPFWVVCSPRPIPG